VIPWVLTAAAAVVVLAGLAQVGAIIEEHGATAPLCATTCLVVLACMAFKGGHALQAHLQGVRSGAKCAPCETAGTKKGDVERAA
jgi:hypothetical protein